MDLFPRVERATVGAEQDTETGFFQDLHVVVVGVAHGPAGAVPAGLLTVGAVHQTHVPVDPVVEIVVAAHLHRKKSVAPH